MSQHKHNIITEHYVVCIMTGMHKDTQKERALIVFLNAFSINPGTLYQTNYRQTEREREREKEGGGETERENRKGERQEEKIIIIMMYSLHANTPIGVHSSLHETKSSNQHSYTPKRRGEKRKPS